ncbi:transmembrane 4 L6 family member 19 [Haemorhous mexicanus]|uniref:transmembrane 4 L6 family member 19 n=1 Tax=Haemorhous mexicanus TaxID=30427 RepID=UPI0028BE8743|nr:transmembrane 4 L6 family member 19 [Haemorhous mexicanus]
MCVGKCSRIVGPCLLVLGTLSMAASILLLFPGGASEPLRRGHIGRHARALPGLWGGGVAVLLAATHITALGWQRFGCSGRHSAFLSVVLSKLALLGAAACFVLCGVGLSTGPLCRYNSTGLGPGHAALWGYPFVDATDPAPDARAENYLYNRSTWSTCLEPEGIVTWHVGLFSLLLLISAAEMVLALLQILNGCLGCLCGSCDGK